jgi:hypothetical protein
VAKALSPAAAKCPVLAAGKPVTVVVNAQTIKAYVPALSNVSKLLGGQSITVTVKP